MLLLRHLFFLSIFCLLLAPSGASQPRPARGPAAGTVPFVLGVVEELYSTNLTERRTLNTWVHAMPKSIVVGIATVNRQRDFTYPTSQTADKKLAPSGGQSSKFIAFLAQELQPYVQRHYRTTAAKTLIGQSLGGLLATEILFNHPALFTQYIIISPSLWWDDGSLLRQTPVWAPASLPSPLAVYLAVGKEGLGPGAGAHVMEVEASRLYAKLASAPNQRVRSYFDYLPQEDHATISHQAIQNAFRWLNARKATQP